MKRKRIGYFFGLLFLLFYAAPLWSKSIPFKNLHFPRLVETWEIAPLVHHPSLRIIDMRGSLLEYLKGHLPNALYFHFENLRVPRNGIPAQNPDRIVLEKIMGEYLSLSNDMWVVLYSEKSNPNATLLAWIFDYLGHRKVGILNGGWEKWVVEGRPITQEYPSLSPKKFFGKTVSETLAEKKLVLHHIHSKGALILDARPPKQYSGEEGEEIRRGHIPGAKNIFWETVLEGEEVRVWKKKEDLEKIFSEAGIDREREIVVHCRTGREASHLYFTLKHVMGYPKVRLYRGSWVEWAADPSLPIKVGMEP